MSIPLSNARVGIYVDGTYVSRAGGHGMRYDVLREFASRDGAEVSRMNLYVPYDVVRARGDNGYRRGQENFCGVLRDFGYKVTQKPVEERTDEEGNFLHAGTTLALGLDAVQQAEHLERILLVTGDGDFADLIPALQDRGCRVEVVTFDRPSKSLRDVADLTMSGFLIPNLLPIQGQGDRESWAQVGKKARGVCYNHSGKGYGFLRYLREAGPGLWITDSRHPDSPFDTVFFHDSQLPRNVAFHQLPSRDHVFEFELTESDRFENDVQAVNLRLVTGPERRGAQPDDAERDEDDELYENGELPHDEDPEDEAIEAEDEAEEFEEQD